MERFAATFRSANKAIGAAAALLGMSAGPTLDACTPEKKDTWVHIEIWCCCDSSYQRCAAFLSIPGADQGFYLGEQPTDGYCGGKGDLVKTEG